MVLRNRLKPFFDWVSPDSVKPTKRSKEYDAVAVSESKKVILFIEAKYRDPAPSSYSGFNLSKQEFSSSEGILAHAKGQRDRVEYFKANIDQHTSHISTKEDLKNYDPIGIVVTRSTPLIHRYQSIEVLSFDGMMRRLSDDTLI